MSEPNSGEKAGKDTMGSHTRNVLTVKKIASGKGKKLRDGGGLWLVTKGSGRYWILDYRFGGKRRQMGLGPYHSVGLAEARLKAEAARAVLRSGQDPVEHRRTEEASMAASVADGVMTFGKYADAFVDNAVSAGRWRGKKTEARWRNMMTNHAAPLREKELAAVGVQDVLSLLRPLWGVKQETAEKLREAIERVLDAAKVEGLREGDNPAAWRGNLEHVFHKPDAISRTRNHAAMPWRELPAFMGALRQVDTIGARALEFTILTAARSGEVRGAVWDEVDLEAKLWTIPAERMKAGKIHRVPLSDRAVEVLQEMKSKKLNDFLFPGAGVRKPISSNTMSKSLRENGGAGFTVHGFRSTMRDWVTEATTLDGDLAEMALAHAVGDAVARAYARSDALEKRRQLMADWAQHCASTK